MEPLGTLKELQKLCAHSFVNSMDQGLQSWCATLCIRGVRRNCEAGSPKAHGSLQRAANEHDLMQSKQKTAKKANRACSRGTPGESYF